MSLVPHYSDDEYDDYNDESGPVVDDDDTGNHGHDNVNLPYFANQEDPEEEDSTSDEDEDDQVQQKHPSNSQLCNSSTTALKNPFRTLDEPKNVEKEESVFHLPFKDEEDQKVKVLERHIKMTTRTDQLSTINDKKICWNFRKGRCRFGHSCVFAHDSDLQEKKPTASAGEQDKNEDDHHKVHKESDKLVKFFGKKSSSFFGQDLNQSEGNGNSNTSSSLKAENDKTEENQEEQQKNSTTTMIGQPQYIDNVEKIMEMRKCGNKRKRPGLSQGLVPGKKVMKDYFKQQQQQKKS